MHVESAEDDVMGGAEVLHMEQHARAGWHPGLPKIADVEVFNLVILDVVKVERCR